MLGGAKGNDEEETSQVEGVIEEIVRLLLRLVHVLGPFIIASWSYILDFMRLQRPRLFPIRSNTQLMYLSHSVGDQGGTDKDPTYLPLFSTSPMSSPNSPSPNTLNGSTICAQLNDSPLSTTSSVLGILTFGLALLGYYVALFSASRSAPSEIQRLVSDLRSTQVEINRVAEWIFYGEGGFNRSELLQPPGHQQYEHNAPEYEKAVTQYRNKVLYAEVDALLSMCVRLFYEADDLLKKSRRDGKGWWRRVQYLVNKDEVLDKVARLQEQKAKLANIQMSLFLRLVILVFCMRRDFSLENLRERALRLTRRDGGVRGRMRMS